MPAELGNQAAIRAGHPHVVDTGPTAARALDGFGMQRLAKPAMTEEIDSRMMRHSALAMAVAKANVESASAKMNPPWQMPCPFTIDSEIAIVMIA